MGLVTVQPSGKPGEKKLDLTDFGRTVWLEDAQLGEALTQWLLHLHLCRRIGGSDVWHLTFAQSQPMLGMEFTLEDLDEYLNRKLGRRNKSHIGPMLRSYEEATALGGVQAVRYENGLVTKLPAPILSGFTKGYVGFFLSLWETHFPKETQCTLDDFEGGEDLLAIHMRVGFKTAGSGA